MEQKIGDIKLSFFKKVICKLNYDTQIQIYRHDLSITHRQFAAPGNNHNTHIYKTNIVPILYICSTNKDGSQNNKKNLIMTKLYGNNRYIDINDKIFNREIDFLLYGNVFNVLDKIPDDLYQIKYGTIVKADNIEFLYDADRGVLPNKLISDVLYYNYRTNIQILWSQQNQENTTYEYESDKISNIDMWHKIFTITEKGKYDNLIINGFGLDYDNYPLEAFKDILDIRKYYNISNLIFCMDDMYYRDTYTNFDSYIKNIKSLISNHK